MALAVNRLLWKDSQAPSGWGNLFGWERILNDKQMSIYVGMSNQLTTLPTVVEPFSDLTFLGQPHQTFPVHCSSLSLIRCLSYSTVTPAASHHPTLPVSEKASLYDARSLICPHLTSEDSWQLPWQLTAQHREGEEQLGLSDASVKEIIFQVTWPQKLQTKPGTYTGSDTWGGEDPGFKTQPSAWEEGYSQWHPAMSTKMLAFGKHRTSVGGEKVKLKDRGLHTQRGQGLEFTEFLNLFGHSLVWGICTSYPFSSVNIWWANCNRPGNGQSTRNTEENQVVSCGVGSEREVVCGLKWGNSSHKETVFKEHGARPAKGTGMTGTHWQSSQTTTTW